jgi:hypothetical protein
MSLTLHVPGDLERRLAAEAARLGLAVEQYALRLLVHTVSPPVADRPSSEDTGRRMAAALEQLAREAPPSQIEDPSQWQREIRRDRSGGLTAFPRVPAHR